MTSDSINEISGLFKKIEEKKYDSTNCFLCGIDLDDSNNSDEHVFPKWIQNRFNLWNQKIKLLNGSEIPYRLLKVPFDIPLFPDRISI